MWLKEEWLKREKMYLSQENLHLILYYEVFSLSFQTFFVQAFKIIVDSWKFNMLLLYILSIFTISGSKEQLQ